MKVKNSLGLTLVELLIVIGLIGILSASLIAIIDPLGQIRKAHDAQRKSDIQQIKRMLELYYNDYNAYPCVQNPALSLPTSSGSNAPCTTIGMSPRYFLFPDGSHSYVYPIWSTAYSTNVPEDPTSGGSYCTLGRPQGSYLYVAYSTPGSPQGYTLFFNLENTSDPDATANKQIPPYTGGHGNCLPNAANCQSFQISGAQSCNGIKYNDWINVP